jgi:hypothetical protein
MKSVDTQRTEVEDKVPVVLQERAISSAPRDVLRAPKVNIDSVAVLLDNFGRHEEIFGIVGTELYDERSVGRRITLFTSVDVKKLISVFSIGVRKELKSSVSMSLPARSLGWILGQELRVASET